MRAGRPRGTPSRQGAMSRPPLPPDVVHLWVVDVGLQSEDSARRRAVTSTAERERASRFRVPGHAERFLAAHGALRLILGDYLALEPRAIPFSLHEGGKPYTPGTDLQFNLSHSGALALIAVAWARQVGVDVEQIRPVPGLDEVAARVCTAEERKTLASLPEPRREGAFLAMWTRKEALAKLTGEGVRALARAHCLQGHDRCSLVELDDLAGYAASVAAEGMDWRLERCT